MYSKAVVFHLHPQNGVSGESEYTISGLVLAAFDYTRMDHNCTATAASGDLEMCPFSSLDSFVSQMTSLLFAEVEFLL